MACCGFVALGLQYAFDIGCRHTHLEHSHLEICVHFCFSCLVPIVGNCWDDGKDYDCSPEDKHWIGQESHENSSPEWGTTRLTLDRRRRLDSRNPLSTARAELGKRPVTDHNSINHLLSWKSRRNFARIHRENLTCENLLFRYYASAPLFGHNDMV